MSLKEAGNCFRGETEVQMMGQRVELSLGEDWVLNVALAGVGAQDHQSQQAGLICQGAGWETGKPKSNCTFLHFKAVNLRALKEKGWLYL